MTILECVLCSFLIAGIIIAVVKIAETIDEDYRNIRKDNDN